MKSHHVSQLSGFYRHHSSKYTLTEHFIRYTIPILGRASHKRLNETLCWDPSPCWNYWITSFMEMCQMHIRAENLSFYNISMLKEKVRGSPKWWQIILKKSWMCVAHSMTMHPTAGFGLKNTNVKLTVVLKENSIRFIIQELWIPVGYQNFALILPADVE